MGVQAKKILKLEELNILYFQPTYGTICTTYVPYNMYMALYGRYRYMYLCMALYGTYRYMYYKFVFVVYIVNPF